MRSRWQTKSLGELCHVIGGGTPSKANPAFYSGNIPWATVRDMGRDVITQTEFRITSEAVRNSSANIIPAGNVIIATRVGLGKVSLVDQDTAINQDLRGIIPRDTNILSTRFLFWWLKTQADAFIAEGTGATVQGVKLPFVKSLQIAFPSLSEQQRIVAILDKAIEGIAIAKSNCEANQKRSHAIFESQLQWVFTQPGRGWTETTVGEVCTLKSGTTVPTEIERSDGDIPYVKVAEMTLPANRDGITTSIRFLDSSDVKPAWIIPAGAVIFPKRGGAILTNKKRLAMVDMCADLNIMAVVPSTRLTPEFLFLYFLGVDMRKLGSGSSIPQINNYDIAPLRISFPQSKKEQLEVTEKLGALEKECKTLNGNYARNKTALAALEKSILHQAFAGSL